MRYTILALALAVMTVSCGSEATNEETSQTEETMPAEKVIAEGVELDPVCEMVRGDDWDEYTVSDTDTVWFCSHVCKGAYDSRPEKYNKEG